MRVLFIHQNFPGQFGKLAAALSARPGFEIYALGDESNIALKPRQPYPVFAYRTRQATKSNAHHYLHSFEAAIRRGQDVVRALQTLRQKNITPDLIIGHPAWENYYSSRIFSRTPKSSRIANIFIARKVAMSVLIPSSRPPMTTAFAYGSKTRPNCMRSNRQTPASARRHGSDQATRRVNRGALRSSMKALTCKGSLKKKRPASHLPMAAR